MKTVTEITQQVINCENEKTGAKKALQSYYRGDEALTGAVWTLAYDPEEISLGEVVDDIIAIQAAEQEDEEGSEE